MVDQVIHEYEALISCLRNEYGLYIVRITALPTGTRPTVRLYRADVATGEAYCVKVIYGEWGLFSVIASHYLAKQGFKQIVAPIMTQTQKLWAELDTHSVNVIVFPFIDGKNAFDTPLSERQWVEFGALLKAIHTSPVMPRVVHRDDYYPQQVNRLTTTLALIELDGFEDATEPAAKALVAYLKARLPELNKLVQQTYHLAVALYKRKDDCVMCHANLHAKNVRLNAEGQMYFVDWDNTMAAPKECDLMFIGGGVHGIWNTADETNLFYRGYGETQIDPVVMAYYRCHYVVNSIAEACSEMLLVPSDDYDRDAMLQRLTDQFLPNNVIEITFRAIDALPPEFKI
jgi:spectinomycin phosphotransferase